MSLSDPEPLVALLTPRGRGAIATLGVQGARAVELVARCFHPAGGYPFSSARSRQIVFGNWHSHGNLREELVVSRIDDQLVEVHCHGGDAATRAIVTSLVQHGAREATATEFLLRIEPDILAVEFRMALSQATTFRTAEHLLAQYQGALRGEVLQLDRLLDAGSLTAVVESLERLLSRANFGRHLIAPWRVVLAGHPNVGKSSLMNALVGYARAIVFEQPGTTRDLLAVPSAMAGWPVELVDAAGLRSSVDPLEATGVALAFDEIARADLVLLVADASLPWPAEYSGWMQQWPRVLVVKNKCDLPILDDGPLVEAVCVSARNSVGIESLIDGIARRLVPEPPAIDDALPVTSRQIDLLSSALVFAQSGDIAHARKKLAELVSSVHW